MNNDSPELKRQCAHNADSDAGIDRDPTDAEVLMTNPERDRWRRIVEAQRKDICDLVRQLEDASRRAAFWEAMAEPLPVTSDTTPGQISTRGLDTSQPRVTTPARGALSFQPPEE